MTYKQAKAATIGYNLKKWPCDLAHALKARQMLVVYLSSFDPFDE